MEDNTPTNFIKNIVEEDLSSGKHQAPITRFPPEPNGHLHVGHSKAICLNFGLGEAYADKGSRCHLRFDDTNPEKEYHKYIESIKKDISWLGFDWKDHLYFASDYFEQLHAYAVQLIKAGLAYVDDLTAEEMREYRGSLKEPGKESPHRGRSIEESLDLFEKMKNGEFKDGEKTLRAKIDMASPNINMRDPILYRIRHVEHPRTGSQWCIYPMYDYTHGISDAIEGITHSLCTLEFQDHRPLYDWINEKVEAPSSPRQIEFAKLALDYCVMGKRKINQLVEEKLVEGWDDPRLVTLSGLRRRGFTAKSLRDFNDRMGVGKKETIISMSLLEDGLRNDLNPIAKRVMGVVDPIKVTITNYPEDKEEWIDCPFHPQDPSFGSRKVPMSKEIYIERSDYMKDAPKKYFRLTEGREVRLRYGYVIKCDEVILNDKEEVLEIKCTYDAETLGGVTPDGRKVKGIIHWVSGKHCLDVEVRLYDRLFNIENPNKEEEGKTFIDYINPDSLDIKAGKCEPYLKDVKGGEHYQFERVGYFHVDPIFFEKGKTVFNRAVTLRDSWAKIQKKS